MDIPFADPCTLWAQHISGSFSQLDVQNAIKRYSVAWEAGGGLVFVSANKARWEVPYDDVCIYLLFLSFCTNMILFLS